MDDFEALLAGSRNDYYGGSWGINPDEYGIPEKHHAVFLLGAELSCARFMVISCDSMNEFDRDVANYNKAAVQADEFFGKSVVEPYEQARPNENDFTAVNPYSGERVNLFNHFT